MGFWKNIFGAGNDQASVSVADNKPIVSAPNPEWGTSHSAIHNAPPPGYHPEYDFEQSFRKQDAVVPRQDWGTKNRAFDNAEVLPGDTTYGTNHLPDAAFSSSLRAQDKPGICPKVLEKAVSVAENTKGVGDVQNGRPIQPTPTPKNPNQAIGSQKGIL